MVKNYEAVLVTYRGSRRGDKNSLTYSIGVLLGRVGAGKLTNVYSTVHVCLEIESTVAKITPALHSPTPNLLLIFDRHSPSWYKFISLLSLPP